MAYLNKLLREDADLWPSSAAEMHRWRISRQRRRMLSGGWKQDLWEVMAKHFPLNRLDAVGEPDASLNVFDSMISQIAVLYDAEPIVTNSDMAPAQAAEFSGWLSTSLLYQIQQTNNAYVLGIKESLIKLVPTPTGDIGFALVPADVVTVQTLPGDVRAIIRVEEARLVDVGGKNIPAWEVWSIEDPLNPYRKIVTQSGEDITSAVLGDDPWVYRTPEGTPYLPYVLYHAKWTGNLWNSLAGESMVEATLNIGSLWTMFSGGLRDASWPQRYTVDLEVNGMAVSKGDLGGVPAGYISTDPTSVLSFRTRDGKTGTAGQFQPGCDPKTMAEAIVIYMQVVLANLGASPSDYTAKVSESGVAIKLRHDARARIAKASMPNFRTGDLELYNKLAMASNTLRGTNYPTTGWDITYQLPRLTGAEMIEELETDQKLVELGISSKVDLYLKRHPGMSREEALKALLAIQSENRQLA